LTKQEPQQTRDAPACAEGTAAAERAGTLQAEIFVLELGIGVGLFARFCAIRSRATSPAALPDTLAHVST
jgi:hypothetical protein